MTPSCCCLYRRPRPRSAAVGHHSNLLLPAVVVTFSLGYTPSGELLGSLEGTKNCNSCSSDLLRGSKRLSGRSSAAGGCHSGTLASPRALLLRSPSHLDQQPRGIPAPT